MDVIVQETNTIEEYKMVKRNLEEQAVACWKIHKKACEEWGHGEPLKVERDKSGILCVTRWSMVPLPDYRGSIKVVVM